MIRHTSLYKKWLIVCLIGIVWQNINSPVCAAGTLTAIQQFKELLQEHKIRFMQCRDELHTLHTSKNVVAIRDKKIELYSIMIQTLEEKRNLFQTAINALRAKYENLKTKESLVDTVEALHKRIVLYENAINSVSQHIERYNRRKRMLVKKDRVRQAASVSRGEIEAEKESVIVVLKQILARQSNLRAGGASPNEIIRIDQKIDILFNELSALNTKLEFSEEESRKEIAEIMKNIDQFVDLDSERRRRNTTQKYQYRHEEKRTKEAIDLRVSTHRSEAKKNLYRTDEIKFDHRLDAVIQKKVKKPDTTVETSIGNSYEIEG
ncbi:MAG: hypothetical protein KKH94_04280 [Candidatus Omnitrophica bacterium]|nr:hypothetical protein [Candidatus Omnitrophota bacterium]